MDMRERAAAIAGQHSTIFLDTNVTCWFAGAESGACKPARTAAGDSDMDAPQKLRFPCDYPIKIMVRSQPGVREAVALAIGRHAGTGASERCSERASAQANFAGLTYVIRATGAAQIEALFVELQAIPGVLLVI